MRRQTGTALAAALVVSSPLVLQQSSQLSGRWVGMHRGAPLHFEFYGDTMLVVNDRYALNARVTSDSLLASGDTTVVARYWFSLDRLLVETPDGYVVTMSAQKALARPLTGRWVGDLGTPEQVEAELVITPGGVAQWRQLPAGNWVAGEWERQTRVITFTWAADSTDWVGHYDVEGNAILFEKTLPGSRAAIFRRVFRR